MCPGLTSKGGVPPTVEKGSIVTIMAESMVHPLGIGIVVMSPNEM